MWSREVNRHPEARPGAGAAEDAEAPGSMGTQGIRFTVGGYIGGFRVSGLGLRGFRV